jgi:membrane protease YdiL (CAAX protease family)
MATTQVLYSEEQRVVRITWYAISLAILFLFSFALGIVIHPAAKPKTHAPSFFAFGITGLVGGWFFFFLGYKGIVASGLRFADVMGWGWETLAAFWSDFKDAVGLLILHVADFLILRKIRPFHISGAHAVTLGQYFLTLWIAVTAGFTEEVIFRGLFLRQFRALTSSISAAILLQAVLFGLAHGGHQSITQFLYHFSSGWLFGYWTVRRRSLHPVILCHILLDVVGFTAQYLKH